MRIDPNLITAARELRDRYLERVNAQEKLALPAAHGKYDVSRTITHGNAMPLLKAG